MRLEDKELEGPELEREQRLEDLKDESTEERDRELPHAGPEVFDLELEHRSRLFDALQAILAGNSISVPMLYLPQRESQALEALQGAVFGRDRSMGNFVFAEDRGALLEQALAILQQNLTYGSAETLAALHTKYEDLTMHVAKLREQLLGLEDAQDDLLDIDDEKVTKPANAETDDNEDDESVTGFIASALQALAVVAGTDDTARSTLVGPDLPVAPKPPSTLEGPERAVAKPASSLDGPALPDAKPLASALDAPGPEVSLPDHVSTLDGPERAEQERRSTLHTEGMSALIVPEHLRPRVAEHQPVGMRTDGRSSQFDEAAPAKDDPRGPKPSSKPSGSSSRDSMKSIETTPLAKPDDNDDKPPSRPTPQPGRRGLAVRSSEKPDPKAKK